MGVAADHPDDPAVAVAMQIEQRAVAIVEIIAKQGAGVHLGVRAWDGWDDYAWDDSITPETRVLFADDAEWLAGWLARAIATHDLAQLIECPECHGEGECHADPHYDCKTCKNVGGVPA